MVRGVTTESQEGHHRGGGGEQSGPAACGSVHRSGQVLEALQVRSPPKGCQDPPRPIQLGRGAWCVVCVYVFVPVVLCVYVAHWLRYADAFLDGP